MCASERGTLEDYLATRRESSAKVWIYTLDYIADKLRGNVPQCTLVNDSLMCYCIMNNIISAKGIARIQHTKNATGNTATRMERIEYLLNIITKRK